MGDTNIEYGAFGIGTFGREIVRELGETFWDTLTDGLTLPDVATENDVSDRNMLLFLRRLESMADAQTVKRILVRVRRYHACHCPFAKASILTDTPVSATLCHCSLGHVMNFLEATLDRTLSGRVLSSVLSGDPLCQYEIDIPQDVMERYVR